VTSQMLTEIRQQPAALAATLSAVRSLHQELRQLAQPTDRVALFARGSSDTAATYGRYLLEIITGLPAALGAPSVATLYHSPLDLSTTLAVMCSQSGQTAELVEVADWARSRGARVVGVTNDASSPLARAVDVAVVTEAGAETAVPATKSHTTCLLALAELALALTPVENARRAPLLESMHEIPGEVSRLLDATDEVETAAGGLRGAKALCVTGRGFTYATALEVALKVEETSAVPCLGLSQADLQHGPLAVLGVDTPVLVTAAADGPTLPGLTAVAAAARARGAPVVVLGGDDGLARQADAVLAGPRLPEPLAPVALVVVGQLLAEALSRLLGGISDQPPGLTKVTQTS